MRTSRYVSLILLALRVWWSGAAVYGAETKEEGIDNIFKVNLAVKPQERVLVFADDEKAFITEEARLVARRGKAFAEVIFVTYASTKLHGAEPPKPLWEKAFGSSVVQELEKRGLLRKLLDKTIGPDELTTVRDLVQANRKDAVNAVIGLAWYSTSHTRFRKLLTDVVQARYASMPAFDPKMWNTAMTANWEAVAQRSVRLKERLAGAVTAHVRTPNGTEMLMDLRDRAFWADTGLFVQPGEFGNLPAGEVAIPPVEGTSKGKMVIERAVNPQLKSQMVIEIVEGKVVNITGDREFLAYLEKTFQKYPLARNIAEFGFGTNDKARPGTTMLELEKLLGTIHLAIGDNSTQGGKIAVPFHIDFLFETPTVDITFADGKTLQIMKDGKFSGGADAQ